MKYMFPEITHIDQVKAAIKNRPEFIVAEREHFDIVNYLVVMPDTFPLVDSEEAALRRECRGIIFDKQGLILSRRFHKFFNVNERDETLIQNIEFDDGHIIVDKMDGSMVTPIYIKEFDAFRWGTKMGLSDVALHAEAFVAKDDKYTKFARHCHNVGVTPIFEYCSRYNKIVVDYPEEQMVLLAIRENVLGLYWPMDAVRMVANTMGISVVKSYDPIVDLDMFARDVAKEENNEGYIVRFWNGHMLKVKSDWYVTIHRAKDNLLHEKNIIKMIINNETDDVKPHLQEEDRKKLIQFENDFWNGFNRYCSEVLMDLNQYGQYSTRKHFALYEAKNVDPVKRSIIFKSFDKEVDIKTEVLEFIGKNLASQTKVDQIRYAFDNVKWEI